MDNNDINMICTLLSYNVNHSNIVILMHTPGTYFTETITVLSIYRVKNGNSPAYKFAHLDLRQYGPHEF